MTMVSKYPLNNKIKERVYEIFLKTMANLKTPEEVGNFLEEFLTPTEKIMLAKRLSIAVLLAKNYDARSICKILKVSLNTVTNMNLWIKHNKGYLNQVAESLIREEQNEEFWNKVEYLAGRTTIPFTTGNWSTRRKNVEIQRIKKIKSF